MACKACEKRRAKLQALKEKKAAKGQQLQAAALGAVLAVTQAAGKAIGITGEETENEASEQSDPVSKGA